MPDGSGGPATPQGAARRPAVFLDRDGVLNALVLRGGSLVSPRTVADFTILPDAADAVNRLRDLGVLVFVVTNQPDLARGHMSVSVLTSMMVLLAQRLRIDDVRVCPHDDPDECACRKPRPGMLLDLAAAYGVDLSRSYMVGDSWRDIAAGNVAGCTTILVATAAPPRCAPDHIVPTLRDAIDLVETSFDAPSHLPDRP